MEYQEIYLQLNDQLSETKLTTFALNLVKKKYPEFIESPLFFIKFYTESASKPFAFAEYKSGVLQGVSFYIKTLGKFEGKRYSNKLSDLEKEFRYREVKKYLDKLYRSAENFCYRRIEFSDEVYRSQKISGRLSIKNMVMVAPETVISDKTNRHILSGNEVLEDGYTIRKQADFCIDFNELFMLRLEDIERVGYHEICISWKLFYNAYKSLPDDLLIAFNYAFNNNKRLPKLEHKQKKYEDSNYNHKVRTKRNAINTIISFLLCDEKKDGE